MNDFKRNNVYRQTEITKNSIDVTFFDDEGIIKYNTYKISNPERKINFVLCGVSYQNGTIRMSENDCPLYYNYE